MRTKLFFTTLILAGLLIACSKQKDVTPVSKNAVQAEKPVKIQLPSYGDLEIVLPELLERTETNTASTRANIFVAPGDDIQAAINGARNNSTIILESGSHTAAATLVIDHKIKLKGESGTVLTLNGDVGIYVTQANGTSITDLEIVNGGSSVFGVAIVDSDHITIKNNDFDGFPATIVLEQADYTKVHNNEIIGVDPALGLGITVVNGDHASLKSNDISINAFGIWACDNDGKAINNNTHNNLIGIILCNVPPGDIPIDDAINGSETPATNWVVTNNTSNNNVWGYLVIDGSNDNTLSNNSASNNALIDMELAFETNNLFGFFTPTSENNTVNVGGQSINIIDCGVNNVVHGGTAASGPCSD